MAPTFFESERSQRVAALQDALKKRILILDGAMGTNLEALGLSVEAFGGEAFSSCNEYLIRTCPEAVRKIHSEFLKSGCDIIQTNTFGGTPLVLGEFHLAREAEALNREAAQLAREVAGAHEGEGGFRWVAGSLGPTTKSLSILGGIEFDELAGHFEIQAKGLIEGGVDFLLLETCQDTSNIKAGMRGIQRAFEKAGHTLPIAISLTIEPSGTLLAGQTVEAVLASIEHWPLLYVGLNCATGPAAMAEHLRSLAALSPFPTACVPNAGLPDSDGRYLETPEMLAGTLKRFAERGWLNLTGGCCGTRPEHIASIVQKLRGVPPREPSRVFHSLLAGMEVLDVDESRPILVGERTNVHGSKKFKRLISDGHWEEAAELAKAQARKGAHLVDICLANPERNELEDMRRFLPLVNKKTKAGITIDSQTPEVVEAALKLCQGKCLINSINLEEGEAKFLATARLAKTYGASLVVGCIDEAGMAISQAHKLEVLRRSKKLLNETCGIEDRNIFFDLLVFPCASGDEKYTGSAQETMEGIRQAKKLFPLCKTLLGISNVSFGLPVAGREVLNAVFLQRCVEAGLDAAIVNTEQLKRYSQLSAEEKGLCDELLSHFSKETLEAFTKFFRDKQLEPKPQKQHLSADERLKFCILEGSQEGLEEALEEKLLEVGPLEIVNGPLMAAMDEVGRLFGQNRLIVAEVLQSAEVMRAAVSHLRPRMEATQPQTSRGRMLLATVKGDVHDIGKNLVEVIFSSNGIEVVDLGTKVLSSRIVESVHAHFPDLIGLSGLLVKSAHQMKATVEDLRQAGISLPVLVGGAALSARFVEEQMAPIYGGTVAYAKDAMQGLGIALQILKGEGGNGGGAPPPPAEEDTPQDISLKVSDIKTPDKVLSPVVEPFSSKHWELSGFAIPEPPDFERHLLEQIPAEEILSWLNPIVLLAQPFGISAQSARLLVSKKADEHSLDMRSRNVWSAMEEMRLWFCKNCQPKAIFQFFRAAKKGDSIELFEATGKKVRASFQFPRKGDCLADYIAPASEGATPCDSLSLFIVTVGDKISPMLDILKEEGAFLKMHALGILATSAAEACAEWLHAKIRRLWGFPDEPGVGMEWIFKSRYRGKRYSFGYPACPNLDEQRVLFGLLRPEEIGICLTEECMMEPEASVSAMVFHHPHARYFSVL
ncbi:MAG: methionine synthase [Proteobacteria bacterium]|nr:methionine synthase [Cystobacterineae bacterium]MCL2258566.1 methionine synthase [Cystobacterineae bacterium]MCL2315141.1 methionine synthase [Pseudomonadota bacterium]